MDDPVGEQLPCVGNLASLGLTEAADGLLLLDSDDLAYSPSKIYPSSMTGRPCNLFDAAVSHPASP